MFSGLEHLQHLNLEGNQIKVTTENTFSMYYLLEGKIMPELLKFRVQKKISLSRFCHMKMDQKNFPGYSTRSVRNDTITSAMVTKQLFRICITKPVSRYTFSTAGVPRQQQHQDNRGM